MTGGIEGAADALTGGLIGRAIEPEAGEARGDGHSGNCLNCGTALTGAYCHACGQQAHIHRSMAAIWHDMAHSVFHFEGKIWRTLPLLAWRPGVLTRRYIDGERARFVSPMALFLFSVFLMFALFTIFGGKLDVPGNASVKELTVKGVTEERGRLEKEIAALERKKAEAERSGASERSIRRITGDIARERANLEGARRFLEGGPTVVAEKIDSDPFNKIDTGFRLFDKTMTKGLRRANDNPNLLLYKVQTNAYKFSWALIPISVPFVWLLFFWQRRFKIYDHAIFVIYSLSFMTLFFTALTLMWWGGTSQALLGTVGSVYPLFHMYRQLRGTYGIGRFSALVRASLLWVFASIALALFVTLLFGLGIAG